MATQLKIKFTEAERKKLQKTIKNLPKELPTRHIYETEEYYDSPYGRRRIGRRETFRGSIIPMADKINHCKTTGGTMSECTACNLKRTEKFESQKKCHFYKKNTFRDKCRWETFGEYCGCVDAQCEARKG